MAMEELRYSVVVRPLSEEDGGGWLAEIPELEGCMSDGETQQEALHNLEEAKAAWLETAEKMGWKIPSPTVKNEEYSGKFTLRLPKSLHKQLALIADKEGISLNQYLLYLITANQGLPISTDKPKADQSSTSKVQSSDVYLQILQRVLQETWGREQAAARLESTISPRLGTHFPDLFATREDWMIDSGKSTNRVRAHMREGT